MKPLPPAASGREAARLPVPSTSAGGRSAARPPLSGRAGEVTRDRILDAADRLFAERGYRATSLRALTRAADVNLAAVHYHFGSKADLLRAALDRHLGPINAERLERLDALERRTSEEPVTPREIFEALFQPAFEFSHASPENAETVKRLVALIHGAAPDVMESLAHDLFGEVRRRFVEALARAAPTLARGLIERRFAMALGSMLALASGRLLGDDQLGEDSLQDLVSFTAAGFGANVSPVLETVSVRSLA